MTREQVKAIDARCRAASPGPWHADVSDPEDVVVWGPQQGDGRESIYLGSVGHDRVTEVGIVYDVQAADGEFIAHAREDIPLLVNEVVQANAILEAIEAALNGEPVSDFMQSFPIVRRVVEAVAR